MDAKALHEAMLRQETYPGAPGPIDFRETHISRLYFTGDHVYKVKKPVDFGFLNFTSLDRRRFYCHEEIRLNQRFCPGTYLDVVAIRRVDGRPRIADHGEVLEYAVRMLRLPEDRMLSRLLAEGDSSLLTEMPRVARRVADLHRESEIDGGEGGRSDLEVVSYNWRENFSQTAALPSRILDPRGQNIAAKWVEHFLLQNRELLLDRQRRGFVREGHGDLHTEHICLTEPVRIFDCIEFNRRLRVGDVASDLAFLLMDLEFRGRRDLSAAALAAYQEVAGRDTDLPTLLPFYKTYRAWVRGKVEGLLAQDTGAEESARSEAAKRSRRYFSLSLGYLPPPILMLTSGMMGVGKSTLARALAEAMGASLLRSDVFRKEQAGIPPGTPRSDPYGTGLYSPQMTRRTYDLLLERSLARLDEGVSVITDASFSSRAERQRFASAAFAHGHPYLVLAVDCPKHLALERLDRRRALGSDPSDGRRELYAAQAARFEPVAGDEEHIRIDSAAPVDYNVHLALCSILEKTGTRA